MKYDTWGGRILKIVAPIGLYFLIGMLGRAGDPAYSLTTSLFEKLVGASAFFYLWLKDRPYRLVRNVEKRWYLWVLLVCMAIGFCIGINLLFEVSGIRERYAAEYAMVTNALYGKNIWLEIAVMLIAAPLAEELLFRGVIYDRMRTYCGYFSAAMISSLIFSAFHGNIIQGIYGFVAGMLCCLLYEQFGTIKACILFHIVANAVSLVVSEQDRINRYIMENPWLVMLTGIVVGCISLGIIWRKIEDKK